MMKMGDYDDGREVSAWTHEEEEERRVRGWGCPPCYGGVQGVRTYVGQSFHETPRAEEEATTPHPTHKILQVRYYIVRPRLGV